jgi:hypothetical protein
VTISKDAEIARSGYPETADEDPRRAAEAVGLFISDTIAVSTAPASLFCREIVLHRLDCRSRPCGLRVTIQRLL